MELRRDLGQWFGAEGSPRPSATALRRQAATRVGMCVVVVVFTGLAAAAEITAGPPPWEVWHDLHSVGELYPGHQVLLRSSRCPSGCPYDRHSPGDWRYIRLDGDEGVVFEEAGAGAVTRIWMTMGDGTSLPLSEEVRMRVYLDGEPSPTIDLPLRALFDGSTPPFVPPLVGDHTVSSGGNFSYVPIPYRKGCRVALLGAHEERIWFQFTFHRLADADGVVSFTGAEDVQPLAALVATRGDDPWLLGPGLPATSSTTSGQAIMAPGQSIVIGTYVGPDAITALRLSLPEQAWGEVELELRFDRQKTVAMALTEFFAVGRGGAASTRSLLVGAAADGALYSYFPMPFFDSAEVVLASRAPAGSTPLVVGWELRRTGAPPPASSGLFTAQAHVDPQTPVGVDIPLLELAGSGRWAGLFVDLSSVDTASRAYLEGDERLYVDGSPHPAVYGTGVEDLFNGGFYFDQGPFGLALHGSPYHFTIDGEDTTAAYRIMPTDGVTFASRLEVGLEGGPEGERSLRVRTVAYAYQRRSPSLWRCDVLDLGDPASRAAHGYAVDGPHVYLELDGLFESEPPQAHVATGVYRPPGPASFVMHVPEGARRLRLRRRLDAGFAGQEAEIWVDGELVARYPPVDANSHRRWREVDVDLAELEAGAAPAVELTVIARPNSGAESRQTVFTAFVWELWTDLPPPLFGDGFESGDTSAWSVTQGWVVPLE